VIIISLISIAYLSKSLVSVRAILVQLLKRYKVVIFKFERDQVLVERDFLITSLHMYHSQHYIIFVYNCKNDVCSWWRLELSSKCPWLKQIVEEKHAANFKTAFIFVSVEW